MNRESCKKSHEVASPQHLSIKIEDSFLLFFFPEHGGENREESTEGNGGKSIE